MFDCFADVTVKAYLHDTICRIRLSFCRMTASADATFFAHLSMVKFET